jgi:hypothetical protein
MPLPPQRDRVSFRLRQHTKASAAITNPIAILTV